ncbi:DUF4102 domain-containing protein [Rosenbergiella australiborealis]|uniref:DUF4102 domain-containing protein n=1 Tax=Rosenbergiella australiborealis TaxID=1544696 RepID=A0ABS5T9T1_9GAMM|nr:DUF4102 domain-containing protein [Rosenbergiella australiborealis]
MLTVKQIEAAKPKDKPCRLLDSDGLYLYIPASGKKANSTVPPIWTC